MLDYYDIITKIILQNCIIIASVFSKTKITNQSQTHQLFLVNNLYCLSSYFFCRVLHTYLVSITIIARSLGSVVGTELIVTIYSSLSITKSFKTTLIINKTIKSSKVCFLPYNKFLLNK